MHTFVRLDKLPSQPWARECASRMALLHAVDGGAEAFSAILKDGSLHTRHEFRRTSTKASEQKLDEPPARYFYAGRVFPQTVGSVVLVVSPSEDSSIDHAKASPFDTGGVLDGNSKLPWNTMPPHTQVGDVKDHTVEMNRFRRYLELHLSAFFDSEEHYWMSAPSSSIDGMDFCDEDDWRDWTFEVRCFCHIPVPKLLETIYVTLDVYTYLADRERAGEIDLPENLRIVDTPAQIAESDAMRACA